MKKETPKTSTILRPPEVSPHLSSGSNTSVRFIILTQSKQAIVDTGDYEWLNQWKWYAIKGSVTWYAVRLVCIDGKWANTRMHRMILGLKKGDGKLTDHRNHNGLDNRRENIRICTHVLNGQNRKPNKGSSSKYKGVCWSKAGDKWQVKITVNKRRLQIGLYENEVEAAKAYDKVAKKHFGEYAHTNF